MAKIKEVKARQVFDSRGNPTVEADVFLEGGGFGRFITPSGASCGKKEALELRDQDNKKFLGKGVTKAISHIHNEIATEICDRSFSCQADLDQRIIDLDGTQNKSRLGANAILAVSGAFFRACADKKKVPLYKTLCHTSDCIMPMPLVNVINGGVHASNGLDIQEFMVVPSGATCFSEAMRMVAEIFYALKSILQAQGYSVAVGDEGGFAPGLRTNEEALDLLAKATESAGYRVGEEVKFALDVAANELYDNKKDCYRLNKKSLDRIQMLDWYSAIIDSYPICSIEDPFYEEDYDGFSSMYSLLKDRLQIVGDDLFVTQEQYILQGIKNNYANSVLIKMNQVGTISETLRAIEITKKAGYKAIISHRSGDSEDTTIADLAVGTMAGQIKTGSMSRSERLAKYNRLLRIEEELGPTAKLARVF